MSEVIQRMRQRDGTAAAWTAANPILLRSEIGYETDTKKAKFGDGVTAWNSLTYFGGGGGSTITRTAAVALGGNRAASANDAGEVVYADSGTTTARAVLGLTVAAAALGASVEIQTSGEMAIPGASYVAGPVYLGATGLLTQVPPATGAVVVVGMASPPSAILIGPEFIAQL